MAPRPPADQAYEQQRPHQQQKQLPARYVHVGTQLSLTHSVLIRLAVLSFRSATSWHSCYMLTTITTPRPNANADHLPGFSDDEACK